MRASLMSRTCCAFFLSAAGAAVAPAAVEFGPNWGLLFGLEGAATYDSNLTARRDNLEDWYLSVTPQATLSRRGSASQFEIDVQATSTWFDEYTEFDSTDPQANLLFAYPSVPGDETRSRLDLHWGRSSATNADLGRRVRSENLRGSLDQRLFDSGRTAMDLVLSGRSSDYFEDDLNTNESWVAGLRAGYALTPRTRVGLVYTHEWMRSIGAGTAGDTDGEEDRVVLRASGELLPTLRGSIEGGVAYVSYAGAVSRDDSAWVGSANLTWQPREEMTAVVRAARYNDFSPDGSTALRSEFFVDLTRELRGGFFVSAGGGFSRTETFSSDAEHQADALVLLAGIGYRMTDRFSIQVADRWTDQSADRAELDYRRHLATGVVTMMF